MLISIMPSDVVSSLDKLPAGFLKLPHPRTNTPALFLPRSTGLLEVQAIEPHAKRSWFMKDNRIISDGKLLFMTPIDPIFILIPLLLTLKASDGSLSQFRSIEDIFEDFAVKICRDGSYQLEDIIHLASLDHVKEAFEQLTERKDVAEDVIVYRFSHKKLLEILSLKLLHLSQPTIFQSHESLQRNLRQHDLLGEKEELQQACRIRASREFLSQYVPETLLTEITSSYDFSLLDEHIQRRAAEFLPTTSANQSNPRKGSKAEAKESDNTGKRKATSQISKGVTKLMKANTNGMAKISSFFAKPLK